MTARRNAPLSLTAQWFDLVASITALLASSQEVIARRLWLLGTQAQTKPKAAMREINRMAGEKMQAAFASSNAMGLAAMKTGTKMLRTQGGSTASRRAGARAASPARAAAKVVRAGLSPVRKRVRANATRLRRRQG
jgi:hypothetical protein